MISGGFGRDFGVALVVASLFTIAIEPADAATTAKGSVLFQTFNTSTSGVGIPGDSSAAITVGIATAPGDTRLTLTGAGPGLTLLTKPELVAPGQVTIGNNTLRGSVTAAALIGGSAASLVSSGVRVTDLLKNLGLTAGDAFLLPAPWLSTPSRGTRKSRQRSNVGQQTLSQYPSLD